MDDTDCTDLEHSDPMMKPLYYVTHHFLLFLSPQIGAAVCHQLRDDFDAQIVVADTDIASGSAVARKVDGEFVHCDVGDEIEVKEMVAHAVSEKGRIDIVVRFLLQPV